MAYRDAAIRPLCVTCGEIAAENVCRRCRGPLCEQHATEYGGRCLECTSKCVVCGELMTRAHGGCVISVAVKILEVLCVIVLFAIMLVFPPASLVGERLLDLLDRDFRKNHEPRKRGMMTGPRGTAAKRVAQ